MRLRLIGGLLAFFLLLGACSGGGSQSATGDDVGTDDVTDITSDDTFESEEDGDDSGSSAGSATTGGGSTVPRAGATITAPSGTKVTVPKDGGPPVADLFKANEDKIGLHDDKIVFCAHAATSFGPAFNTSEADLNVYWEEVGKINGRNVEITFENDNYDPTTARQAAQACKEKNPFVLLGGIGFDQIPAVRKFAEDNRMPYFHHIAAEDLSKKFAFSSLPSVNKVGDFAGQWVVKKFKGKKVGVIYRESENWEPGHQTFLKRLKDNGMTVPPEADLGVVKNQGAYANEIRQLNLDYGAEVVFLWENALAATAIIQQAKSQDYHPQFVIFPFNVTTDVIGDDMLNPPVHGIATWPAYSPGDYGGTFSPYADEIKRMEQVYAQRRPGIQVTDIHWQVWLAWRDLHTILEECGRDCTRNKFVGLLLWRPYELKETKPSCPVDFTRNGHVGGFWATMFTAYAKGGGNAGWKHIDGVACKSAFL